MKPNYLFKTRKQAIARARRKHGLKDYEGSLKEWDELLERNQEDGFAMLGRFDCLLKLDAKEEVLAIGETVCEANPESQAAQNNYACLLLEKRDFTKAIKYFNNAIALDSSRLMYFFNAGLAYRGTGQLDRAAVCFERVISLEPDHQRALEFLSQIYVDFGIADKAVDLSMRLRLLRQGYTLPLQRRLYCMFADPTISEQEKSIEVSILRSALPIETTLKSVGSKLIICWLVCKYSLSVLRYIMPMLMRYRDPDRMEFVGLTNEVLMEGEQIEHLFDRVECLKSAVARDLHDYLDANPVDILFDTAGQVPNNFMSYYTKRLAPKQLSWPITHTDAEMVLMDQCLVDTTICQNPTVKVESKIPGSISLQDKLCFLDNGLVAYDTPTHSPDLVPLPALENGYITFGVCANLIKINAESLQAWCEILSRVNKSRLLIASNHFLGNVPQQHLLDQFSKHGIKGDQVDFYSVGSDFSDRFDCYQQMDIVLNPFPFGEFFRLSDAIWMGCPVLCCVSSNHTSRLSQSIMASAGKLEWVYEGLEDYVSSAISLSLNTEKLNEIRQSLREELTASQLMRTKDWSDEFFGLISC